MEERKRRWRIKQNYNLMGVYSITNRTNGKVYVGSSTKLMERLKQHERSLMAGKHPVKALQQDYDAGHHFQFDILELVVVKSAARYGDYRKPYNLLSAAYLIIISRYLQQILRYLQNFFANSEKIVENAGKCGIITLSHEMRF